MTILSACLALGLAVTPAVAQQGPEKGQQKAGKAVAGAKAKAQPQRGNAGEKAQAPRGRAGEKAQGQPGRAGEKAQPQRGASERAGGQGRGTAGVRAAPGNTRAGTAELRRETRARAKQSVTRLPQSFRALEGSRRASDRFVLGAAAFAAARGLEGAALDVRRGGNRVEVRNRRGDVLFDLDDDRARNLGHWDLRLLGDRDARANAPAFCRSGAGHPVWGREWCLDKGFGLGRSNDRLWSRTNDPGDIIFGRRTTDRDRYDRGSLIDIVGDIVVGRLALHALSLGFDQPLAGRWVEEPNGPRLMLVDAGPEPVAELVDWNGDGRVDVLYVTQYGW